MDNPNPRRSPALLALVFGVFLFIIGVTATGQSILVSSHVTTQSLDAVVAADASLARILVNGTVVPADLDPATLPRRVPPRCRPSWRWSSVAATCCGSRCARRPARSSSRATASPRPTTSSPDFAQAAAGSTCASIEPTADSQLGTSQVLTEWLPITADGVVRAVLTVTRDAEPVLARIDAARQEIVVLTLTAAVVVAIILYLIFRSAHGRLRRQTRRPRRGDPSRPADRDAQPRRDRRVARQPHRRGSRLRGRGRGGRSSISTTSDCSTTPTGTLPATTRSSSCAGS